MSYNKNICFFCNSNLQDNISCHPCSLVPTIRNVQSSPKEASFYLEFQNCTYRVNLNLESKQTKIFIYCGKGLFEILLEFPGTFLNPNNIISKLKLYYLFS